MKVAFGLQKSVRAVSSVKIKNAFAGEMELDRVNDISEIAGHGVSAIVDGRRVFAREHSH